MIKCMKALGTTIICLCIISLISLIVSPGWAGPPTPPVHQLLPDLVVNLKLVVKKYVNFEGVTCYSTMPEYTVTNKGLATAKNFSVKVYWMRQGKTQGKAFRLCGENPSLTLAPGKSWTQKASAVNDNVWCADKKGKVGFRVIAVYSGKEKNKKNNTATAYFLDFTAHPDVLKNKAGSTPAVTRVKPK